MEGPNGWFVSVWDWPDGAPLGDRQVLGTATGLRDAQVAIDWASSMLKNQGARVFIGGREQPLAKFLAFSPAPKEVP